MATITEPMALDKTFNTTETTPRSQADVLAAIENAIRQGFGRSAADVSYDNTTSGLTADDVQEAIDELAAGKVDKVEGKGLSSNDFTDEDKAALDNMELDIESTQTVSGNPLTLTDCAPINAESLAVEFSPKQDLHGQSAPYVGGAGKQKLPLTVANLKALNTNGTWSGNTYTENNVTFAVQTDDGGNVTGINISGTPNAWTEFYLNIGNIDGGEYILSNQAAVQSGMYVTLYGNGITEYLSGGISNKAVTLTTGDYNVYIGIDSGKTVDELFKPMLCLASASDPTVFAPYSNICPITGYDEVEVDDVGKNKLNLSDYTGNSYAAYGFATTISGEDVIVTLTNYPMTGATESFEILMNTDAIFDKTGLSIKAFISSGDNYVSSVRWSNIQSNNNIAIDLKNLSQGLNATITMRIMVYDTSSEEPTTYEPYQSRTASVTFGQTVYGGKSNFTDGGTEGTKATETITSISARVGVKQFYKTISGMKSTSYKVEDAISNEIPYNISSYGSDVFGFVTHEDRLFIRLPFLEEDTGAAANNWLANNPLQLCYELATPDEISTPPIELKLLKGTNNLTADGVMQIGYQPDNVIGEVKGEIEKCAVDAEFAQFTDGNDTFTDVNLTLDGYSHTVSMVGSKIEQKRFICFEVAEIRSGSVQGIHASCIAFADGAKTPSGTAFRAYIESLQMYVNFRIYGSGGSYMLSYQSETSFSASAFYVRVRMMNNL